VNWQKTDGDELEALILSVDESYRITLPQSFCRRISWITGDQPHNGWLLIGSPGRCRLLSSAEVDIDPNFQSLRARITTELTASNHNSLEFQDEASAALALRLVPVEVTPRKPGWRLTLPRVIAAIMHIRPRESEIAALFLQEHIEFWTIETLRSSVATPLTQML